MKSRQTPGHQDNKEFGLDKEHKTADFEELSPDDINTISGGAKKETDPLADGTIKTSYNRIS